MKHINSSDSISHELVSLMGTFGTLPVKKLLDGAKHKEELIRLLNWVLANEFVPIKENKTNVEYKVPYQSVEKALRDLKHFTVDDPYYGTEANKLRKLDILLESLGFVESEAVFKLITKQFDVAAVQTYLKPPVAAVESEVVKKSRKKA